MKPRTNWLKILVGAAFLLPMMLILIGPFAVMITTAFKTLPEVSQIPPTFIPANPTTANFQDIWTAIPLAKHFSNSMLLGVLEMVLVLALGAPAAYALCRFRFAGRNGYMFFLLVTQMFPAVVVILGVFRVISALQLTDNLLVVAITAAAFNMAFCIWLLTGYFAAIPVEIEHAAMLDGDSHLGAMLKMTLPLAWPGLIAVAIFAFMDGWNEFLFSLTMIRSDDQLPLTVGLFRFITRFQIQWNYLMAASLLATVVVVVLFMLVQDKLTRGMLALSDK